MANKVKGLTVEINGDTTKLSKALREVKSEATILKSHLSALGKLEGYNGTDVDLITQKQGLLGRALIQNRESLQMMRKAEQEYLSSVGPRTQAEQREFESLQRTITQTELQYEQLREQAVQYGASAPSEILKTKAALAEVGGKLEETGQKLLVFTAGVAAVGYMSANAAIEFESSFTGVRKTVDATEEEFDELAQATRDMALEKPIDVNDINYAMELGGQLGVATENLEKFASVSSDLDIATNMDIEDASMKLAQFMNIVGMSESDVDRLGSVITDLGNNSATTESKIMNMAMRIAGSGSNIGMSAQQILALATSLSSVGIEAEMGGNAISTIMNRIDKDIALNTNTLQVWAETAGMSAEEFAAKWETDVMGALLDVINGMATYRDEGGNLNTLLKDMDISYMRQVDTMQRLSRTGDLVTGMVDVANSAWDQNIALTREAGRRYETTASQIQIFKNNFNEFGISIGEILVPSIRDASEILVSFAKWLQSLDEGTQRMIVGVAGLAAAAGPLLVAAGKAMQGASKMIGFASSLYTTFRLLTVGTLNHVDSLTLEQREMAKANAKVERAAVLHGALNKAALLGKAALAGLAIVCAGVLINAIKDSYERTKKLNTATSDLADLAGKAKTSVGEAADSINAMSTEPARRQFGELKQSIDDTIESQAQLKEDIVNQWNDMDSSEYALDTYIGIIETLTGKYDENGQKVALTAEEQAKLKAALDGYNQICGTTYEITDKTYGVISTGTEELKKNAEQWINNAKAQAAAERIVELQKQGFTLEQNYQDAQAEVDRAGAHLAEVREYDMNGALTTDAENELAEAERLRDEALAQLEANQSDIDFMVSQIEEANLAMTISVGEIMGKLANVGDGVKAAFEEAGVSQEEFAQSLSDAGVTVGEFNMLSESQLEELVRNYDGSFDSIDGKFAEFNEANQAAFASMSEHADSFGDSVDGAFEKAGRSQDDFVTKLVQSGVSVDDFKTLTQGQLEQLAGVYDGTFGSIAEMLQGFIDENRRGGEEGGQALADGAEASSEDVITAAANMIGLTADQFKTLAEKLGYEGEEGVRALADGIASGQIPVGESTAIIKMLVSSVRYSVTSEDGYHMINNFAKGIRNARNSVLREEMDEVGSTIKNIIGHSIPKEGPLHNNGKGEEEWGRHLVQNFARGMREEEDALSAQSERIASLLRGSFDAEMTAAGLSAVMSTRRAMPDIPTTGNELIVTVNDARGDQAAEAAYMIIDALPSIISTYTPVMGERDLVKFGRRNGFA